MKYKIDLFIKNPRLIKKALNKTRKKYRRYDPGWYLYRKLLQYNIKNKFNNKFIELVYVTLSTWNMNSRGAKLQKFRLFKKSIIKNKKIFLDLSHNKLSRILDKNVQSNLKDLFSGLNLVANGKPRLVTYSKTMHFFLPKLIVPIDRKYTMRFFYGNTNVPSSIENQFKRFCEIEKQYTILSKSINLNKFKDRLWNSTIPKILDNMIIGYLIMRGIK